MNDIEEIKQKIDIVDLISQYLTLNKAGANYRAPCPFHREKTPSLMVSPDKQIYKCFGCGEGGDVFSFIMKMENLEFVEALNMLADRAGIILDKRKSKKEFQEEKDAKSQLYKINLLSAKVFQKVLIESKSGEIAMNYLKKRGLKAKTIKDFFIGYAPEKPILKDFLIKRGFNLQEIRLAGSPEKFFKRIIFPIFDVMGNIVGFTGRTLDNVTQPKYFNTPESPIFHKSRILYGLNFAKSEIKNKKKAVMVEGQMDVILSHQCGIANVVASSGTALTADHLSILGRYNNNIIFAYDNDHAGQEAVKKAIEIAITNDLNAKIVVLPVTIKDPGEAIEKDPEIWKKSISQTVPAIEWIIEKSFNASKTNKLSGQEKKEVAKSILPYILLIPDQIEKSHYIKIIADRLGVGEKIIQESLSRITSKRKTENNNHFIKKELNYEEKLVALLMLFPKYLNQVVLWLDYLDFTLDKEFSAEVYKKLESCYTKDNCDNLVCLKGDCKKTNRLKLDSQMQDKIKFLVLEIEKETEGMSEKEINQEIVDIAKKIKRLKKEEIKVDFAQKIKVAEKNNNIKEVKKILEELQREIGKK